MKKLTYLFFILVCAIGFSQQEPTFSSWADYNPDGVQYQNVTELFTTTNDILSGDNSRVNTQEEILVATSIDDLLTRLAELGTVSGSISDYFTPSELQQLKSHFANLGTSNNQHRIIQGITPEVEALLDRLAIAGNSAISEPADLFTNSERALLQDYFSGVYPSNGQGRAPGDVWAKDIGFCTSGDFGTFPVGGPYTLALINNTATPIFAGELDDSGVLFGLDNDGSLVTIDQGTGAETVVGPLTGLITGHTVSGLAWNEADGTMYASSTDGGETYIYTIDRATGTMTPVGNTGSTLGIWLAIDSSGNAFMADIGDDNLYSISLIDGTGTLVGPLGIDISFAQDADFDPDTDILYMAAYIGGGVNQFASVDTATGAATPLGTVNADCAEIGIVAIEGAGGGGGGPALAYGNEAVALGFGNFDPADPSVFNPVSAPSTADEFAGAIDPNDPTTAYVIGAAGDFSSLDIASGVYTSLGNILAPNGETWTGLEFDPTDGTLYGLSATCGVSSAVSTIDIGGVSATTVGSTSMTCAIALAIDGGGNAWAYDIVDDNLYSVDLTTGASTLVGSIGFDANFAQGMCWDPNSDTVYMAAFNNGAFAAEWRSVDTGTGATTLIGVINPPDLADMGWVSIPGTGGGGGGCTAGVYTDRAAFDAETAGGAMNLEDFGGGPLVIMACNGPINNAGNDCYPPGEILPGIEVTNNDPANPTPTVVIPAGALGNADVLVGPNTFADVMIVNFPDNDVNSFGLDLQLPLIAGAVDVDLRIFGTGGLIETQTVTIPDGATPVFFGYIASEIIVSVEIEDNLSAGEGELTAMVSFGMCTGGGGGDNDDCADAFAIACGDTLSGDTSDNTDTNGDGSPDEWFAFTSTQVGELVTVSTCDQAAYDTILTVYDSCGGAVVAMNDDGAGCSGFTSELDFVADGSSTYYIAVDGFGGASGAFDLSVTCSAVANDLCENAIAVDCGESVSGTTINATIDDAVAPTCDTGVTSPGVWYAFTDSSGLVSDVTITMCSGNGTADYDSKLSVYTGDCGAPPLTCVVGNDDTCGLQSEVSFQSDGSTTYLILVHGFGGATGDFTIDINCIPVPPPNDDIVNAIDVVDCNYTDEDVAMPAATTEGGNPVDCDISGANGVWYKFTPDTDGSMTCTIDQPAGTSAVTFYTAPDDNATETDLVLVDYFDNQCVPGTTTTIPTVVGQWYYTFVVNTGGITDITFECDLLGVEDNQIAGFSYYPNPADETINLSALDNIDNVVLYNILGQKLIDLSVDAISTQVNVSNLSTGAYIMKVTVGDQIGTYKVLKR